MCDTGIILGGGFHFVLAYSKTCVNGHLFKRQPVYEGHFARYQMSISCINIPVFKGHLSIKDSFSPFSVAVRDVLLYFDAPFEGRAYCFAHVYLPVCWSSVSLGVESKYGSQYLTKLWRQNMDF